MNATPAQINDLIDTIASRICMLEKGNIPIMGNILNAISGLEEIAAEIGPIAFPSIVQGLKHYMIKLIMEETDDFLPLEKGIMALQTVWQEISDDKPLTTDIAEVLKELDFTLSYRTELPDTEPKDLNEKNDGDHDDGNDGDDAEADTQTATFDLSDEDCRILLDFVIESKENLETIELRLIDLENAPDDMDIINSIFRPFHTIKGVSGFLELNKINSLCHHTENLIDNARNGKLHINDAVTDIILESVDTLLLMLADIEKKIAAGIPLNFDTIDIEKLLTKIVDAESIDGSKEPLGRILVEAGSIQEKDLRESLKIQKTTPEKKLGNILVQEKLAAPDEIRSALKTQSCSKLHVKVDTTKLDNLVDLTGELVIAQSLFRQIYQNIARNDPKYVQSLNQVTQTVSSIQKIAMSMRMVPIKNTFQKMFRVVRDLAKTSGKETDLFMSGEETEIDKNVVDELYEPMVHMIRNSMDHGLETPAEREAAGKNRKGIIHLRAYQKGGNIVIEIEDDGKGLDKQAILEKAAAQNLFSEDERLSDKEIYNFIMHPGFSTAKAVTDISGRGVGMDVVKRSIERLRGRLEISSEPGRGTVFTISLPLTMAIVEGMLVRVGKERYIIPTHAITESLRPEQENCHTIEKKGEMIKQRETLIPLVRINRLFSVNGGSSNPWEGIVVIVDFGKGKKALLFDELLGKEEFVIKSLGETFQHVKGLAGGAILSDGKVGLILDMAELFQAVEEQ